MAFNNPQALSQFLILESAVVNRKRYQLNLSPSLTFKYMHMGRQVIVRIKEEFESIQIQKRWHALLLVLDAIRVKPGRE
jgi:hypothetical protein